MYRIEIHVKIHILKGGDILHLDKKITLNMVDLDHILDVDEIAENINTPPSLIFLEGLARELEMSGYRINDIDIIEFNLE